MKDITKKLEEVAELAERTKDQSLRRFGRPPKPQGEVGQVYSIRIPVSQIAQLEEVAAERGEAPRTMIREWVLERLKTEAHASKGTRRTAKGSPGRPNGSVTSGAWETVPEPPAG
ncbi:MAG: hypothetical protein ACRDKS_08855 [Actinomycetota bacterium]